MKMHVAKDKKIFLDRLKEDLTQNPLDIGAHLLASEIKNDWEDYGELMLKLGKHGVIP